MRLLTKGPEETVEAGFRLGKRLRKGNTVFLYGDLGAGKTTFVKGIARAIGLNERDITSASFTIVAEYDSIPPFYHIDLYRIESHDDIDSAGIYEYVEGDGIAVVEWAERLHYSIKNAINVKINLISENTREIIIEGQDNEDWDNNKKRPS